VRVTIRTSYALAPHRICDTGGAGHKDRSGREIDRNRPAAFYGMATALERAASSDLRLSSGRLAVVSSFNSGITNLYKQASLHSSYFGGIKMA